MQFDLFIHSEDVLKRNAVIAALQERNIAAMRLAIDRLRAAFPGDSFLACFEQISAEFSRFEGFEQSSFGIAEAVQQLESGLLPPLHQLLGESAAQAWLAPAYAKLAEAALPHPFSRQHPEAHAAALFLKAGLSSPARTAVNSIASWRQIPEPLAWMSEIALRENRAEEFWPLLAELAWIAPALLNRLLRERKSVLPAVVLRYVSEFHTEFCADSDVEQRVDEIAWLPAWLLIEHSELQPALRLAHASDSPPARSAALLINLLLDERQGIHSADRRQQLKALSPTLFRRYMARR